MNYVNREAIDWSFERAVETPNDKLVLLTIARRANKYWAAFPSKKELARITGLAEATIDKSLRRLDAGGHLARVPFVATNGQDQRPGFVLAGGGRVPDGLDAEFLAVAFAERKQMGVPLAVKPQHWSGANGKEGGASASLGGGRYSPPEGGAGAAPRRKEHTEDRKGQEEAFGRAADRSAAAANQGAVARVAAAAATRNSGSLVEPEIPKQRMPREPNGREQRDDDWRVQLAAADVGLLESALDCYRITRDGVFVWALGEAGGELGIDADPDESLQGNPELLRNTILFLLKKHAGEPDVLEELTWPLDNRLEAEPRRREWDVNCYAPQEMTTRTFAEQMCEAVRNMAPLERGPQIAEIRRDKPGVWRECRDKAKRFLRDRNIPAEITEINAVAMQYAILRYLPNGKWPMAVVPVALRPMARQSEAPPWAA